MPPPPPDRDPQHGLRTPGAPRADAADSGYPADPSPGAVADPAAARGAFPGRAAAPGAELPVSGRAVPAGEDGAYGPPRRRPTIADVARRAGVSAAAVSFAVNNRPGVSPETRTRILAAARELGWRPSASARRRTQARPRAGGRGLGRQAGPLGGRACFV